MEVFDGNNLKGDELLGEYDVIDFDYSGSVKQITLPLGSYRFECWGAAGTGPTQGGYSNIDQAGYGGYCSGVLYIEKETIFYIYVGERPPRSYPSYNPFNGVGVTSPHPDYNNGVGGGATDIRLIGGTWNDINSLRSRIMVAGAGGGVLGNNTTALPHAGGLIGKNGVSHGSIGYAGSQTSGNAFGVPAGNTRASAGSGYYGGTATAYAGGGGSSFISGHPGCDAIDENGNHTGEPVHYSGLIFEDTIMKAGDESLPHPFDEDETVGNVGNGFVRITTLPIAKYLIKSNDTLYYRDGSSWETLDKTEDELTNDDFSIYGELTSSYLTKSYLSELGTELYLLKSGVKSGPLHMAVTPFDQVSKQITPIYLPPSGKTKIIPEDIGCIWRLFSVDGGVTWETFVNGTRQAVELTGNRELDAETIREAGLTTQALQDVTAEMWGSVFSSDEPNEIKFLTLLSEDNKTKSITVTCKSSSV